MKRRRVLTFAATAAVWPGAMALPAKPLLRISGRVGRVNNNILNSYEFSEAAFMQLAMASIATSTPWSPMSVFTGPLLQTVMREAGVTAGTLNCKTLDDYSAPIPWEDLARFEVILAHSQNGQRLSEKRWGPLWTIYPRDTYPEALSGPIAESRFIWQINRIDVSA